VNFTAPKTFEEYLALFPNFHRIWLRKHYRWLDGKPEDFEDAAQHLMLETLRRDRVQKYDAKKRGGKEQKDTPGLFLHFMGQCFANDMRTLHTAKQQQQARREREHVKRGRASPP
jgi:hypothetical protein